MNDDKEYKPFSQLINELDNLKKESTDDDKNKLIDELKELVGISYEALGLSTQLDNLSDGYRWVVIIDGEEKLEGAVFMDMKHAGKYVGISESTFRRRVIENGYSFNINGYNINRLPYYKSKRGNNG